METITTFTKVWLNLVYIPFIWVMQYLDLEAEVISIFAILLSIDLVTGWAKTVSLGEKPRSRRLAKGILAKSVLLLMPIVLALGAKAIHMDATVLVYVFINALILSEVYSIIGNIYTIRTGRATEEYDVISKILKVIRTMLNRLLEEGK